jgi:hypothetical protein
MGWLPSQGKQSTQKQRRTASDTDGLNDKRPGMDLGRPRKRWQRVDGGTGQTTQSMEEEDDDDDEVESCSISTVPVKMH